MFFYPEEHTLKILCWYLNWKCVTKLGGSRRGVLGVHWVFLTRDMDYRVIHDILNAVILPYRSHPENFVLISQLEVDQEGGIKKGVTWRTFRVPDWWNEWQGHSWRYEWWYFTLRNMSWKFCDTIVIESVSGRGGQEGEYREDVEGSWLETWMTGSFLTSWMM